MSATAQSEELREEGNALYKAGKLDQAIAKYKASAKRTSSSAPLRNLSAAYYETGKYGACKIVAEKAMKLLETAGGEDRDKYATILNRRIEKAKECIPRSTIEEQNQRRIKIMKTLPRYRPSMLSSFEHYAVGHDDVLELFDLSLEKVNPDDPQRSFLFAGIGDARHMYRMFWDIYQYEERGMLPKSYHWTIIDINKYAMARNLIIFMLLQDLSHHDDYESEDALLLLTTIFYIFSGSAMPSYAFDKMQQTISKILALLEAGNHPVGWLYLHEVDLPLYIQVLTEWQCKALKVVTMEQYIQDLVRWQRRNEAQQIAFLPRTTQKFRHEKILYTRTGLLYPPQRMLDVHEPGLRDLIKKHPSKPKKNAGVFREFVTKNWKMNVTLVSLEWLDGGINEIDLNHDPFTLIDQITTAERSYEVDEDIHLKKPDYPPIVENATCLYDQISPFFLSVAKALKKLEGRIQVEAIVENFVDSVERMRYDLYRDDKGQAAEGDKRWPRPKEFPVLFDRIHLSNIPDYIGGHLSTFLYTIPILKKEYSSIVMSNCLRNSSLWAAIDEYIAHYQSIPDDPDDATLEKITQTKILTRGDGPMPLAEYTAYQPSDQLIESLKQDFASLLPRKEFTKWFYTMFFNLALPALCDIAQHHLIVLSPLNLTILFQMICHLRTLGYPSHWLSEISTNIIQDKVITTCRPPRSLPTRPEDLKRLHKEKRLATAPFKQEIATLAQISQPLLPFTLPPEILPSLNSIYKYHFNLSRYNDLAKQPSCLLLAIWDADLMNDIMNHEGFPTSFDIQSNFRCFLDPSWGDEVDDKYKNARYRKFREEGVVVWTTFEFDIKEKIASAWMPEELVEDLKKKDWECGMYRTDIWQPAFTLSVRLSDAIEKGERWIDWKDGA